MTFGYDHSGRWTRRVGLAAALVVVATGGLFAQQRDTAYLKIKVDPGRAGVFVDGKYVGPAANMRVARKYAVSPGSHDITLVDPRFQDMSFTVECPAGKTTVVSREMQPVPIPKGPFGTLRIKSTDKFAAVYINGKYFGHADEFSNISQGIQLPPGEYTVLIAPLSGAVATTTPVKLEANKTMMAW